MKTVFLYIISIVIYLGFTNKDKGLGRYQQQDIRAIYCEEWTAGVKGGGGGIICSIEVSKSSRIILDSIYYMGATAKIDPVSKDSIRYKAILSYRNNTQNTISIDTKEAPSNGMSLYPRFPHVTNMVDSKTNCVLSYKLDGTSGYIKFDSIPFQASNKALNRN